ncbi:hypothetical protein AAFF_G00263420 [Aldrovandia affinis]|uniref:Uncharacterized protein n=1 Tax=Aldrovandia affinis TaxID=143900 RepID=A0AAD7SSM7_9TELE|nr:hypothetical protein AAFF_G00263420 [Aldrovandia affinis]
MKQPTRYLQCSGCTKRKRARRRGGIICQRFETVPGDDGALAAPDETGLGYGERWNVPASCQLHSCTEKDESTRRQRSWVCAVLPRSHSPEPGEVPVP